MTASYAVKDTPVRPLITWVLEDGVLIRRRGASETRLPLSSLTRMTLLRRTNRYGPDMRAVQLRFGRRTFAFAALTWRGIGRPEDQTAAFSAFVRALAAEAAEAAPAARFRIGGRASVPAALYWTAALLAAAVVTLMASAIMAGFFAVGLDWGARLLFVLILLFVATPWIPGADSAAFDPLALPQDMAPRL